ncbi:MAG: mechanosensitive ion channel domain-containing protein, partial [Bacteroidota bacterium]
MEKVFEQIREFLEIPIVTLGQTQITLWTVLYFGILFVLLVSLTGRIQRWILGKWSAKTKTEIGARQATVSIIRYSIISFGFLIIIQTAGIDLTTLNVLAGAVGIGVGFGLQNIANNFISGIIILFERPIKIGDRIEVGDVEGDVIRIGARSTTVITNDNITVIVPNSQFISENVINWSHNDDKVRFRIPVSVAYGSDARLVERLLIEVATKNPDVLEDPVPGVRLMEFGDSGLQFELRAWTNTLTHRKGILISALNFAI